MYRLQVKDHFDAAHFLKGYVGKCSRMHGHRWEVEVCLEGEKLDYINMLVDFSIVKKTMKEVLEHLDHYVLNERLSEENVTAEFLARSFFENFEIAFAHRCVVLERVSGTPKSHGVELARVCIWESPDCCVKYSPYMRATGEADE